MGKSKVPSTPALRLLKTKGVDYVLHTYTYEARGGTKVSSRELGVDEHAVIKTLIFEDEHRKPVVVLMHGDLEVSGKALARFLGVKIHRTGKARSRREAQWVPCRRNIALRSEKSPYRFMWKRPSLHYLRFGSMRASEDSW